jgi:hypothetical protein
VDARNDSGDLPDGDSGMFFRVGLDGWDQVDLVREIGLNAQRKSASSPALKTRKGPVIGIARGLSRIDTYCTNSRAMIGYSPLG